MVSAIFGHKCGFLYRFLISPIGSNDYYYEKIANSCKNKKINTIFAADFKTNKFNH